jgi:phenylacetate-CoA ligase
MSRAGRKCRSEYFDETESWPEARLQRLQFRKLKRLLSWASRELPFYRRRFDEAGFHPDHLRGWGDFRRVPILTKQEVLKAMEGGGHFAVGMETEEPDRPAVLGVTSGTLGTTFLSLSRRWRSAMGRGVVRAYWWAGLSPGMRVMTAAPAWHGLAVKESYAVQRLRATSVVPWGTFLPRFSGEFLDALLDLRPQFVSLFLPMLYALLAECARRGARPEEVFRSVTSLVVNGAPLTPRSREALKEELGVNDLFEGLGSSEGLVAMECSFHRGHHVFVDTCYVEVVHPVTKELLAPGMRGSVVVTSLIPHGSVYIRYDTGDLGEMLMHRCQCGRTWPLLEVYDRCANRFAVNGREMVPYDVRLCLDELPELVGIPFAVIREEENMSHLRLAIQGPPVGDLAPLGAKLKTVLEEGLAVKARVEWVEELPARWKGTPVIAEKEWGVSRG